MADIHQRIKIALDGNASKRVTIKAPLSGPSAEAWDALREASQGLNFGDKELVVLLLIRAGTSLRSALRGMPREDA